MKKLFSLSLLFVFLFIQFSFSFSSEPGTSDFLSTYQLTPDQFKISKKGTSFYGPTRAEISILVFTDFACPFCKKMHQEKTIQNLQKKYSKKLNYAFRHFPLGFNDYANSGALASECVREQLGKSGFYNYLDTLMNKKTVTSPMIQTIAYGLGIDKKIFDACYFTAKYQKKIDASYDLGVSLGVNGTPFSLIINTKTRQSLSIPGVYPQENFEEAIDFLLTTHS